MVRPEKLAALKERMESLGIREQDLEESFVRGAGRGGQKVNKTNNCVYLKHVPTGIAVKCHVDRSRELNRFLARRELCDAVERQQASAPQKPALSSACANRRTGAEGVLRRIPGRQRKTCKQSPWTHRCMYPCSMGNFR